MGPETVAAAPFRVRRRFLLAAAATGIVLTAPGHARGELSVTDAPEVMWGAVDATVIDAERLRVDVRDLRATPGPEGGPTSAALAVDPPQLVRTAAAPTSVAARDIAREVDTAAATPAGDDAAETGEVQRGALPDGAVELARWGEVAIVTEGRHVELVGFHESSTPTALAMVPALPVTTAHHAVPGSPPGPNDATVVLPTRGRGTAPTTAIDLAMTPGTPVVAPVTGEVVESARYALYGRTADRLLRIRPDDDPSVIVSVVHIAGPRVEVGDRVVAGETRIAREARQLPFASQIDRFTAAHRGEAGPHIHIELRPG